MRGCLFVLLGALFVACHSPPAPVHVAVVEPEPSSPPVAEPVAASPSDTGPPTLRAELSLIAQLPCAAEVFVLAGATFVACGSELLQVDAEGSLRRDANLARGLRLDAPGIAPPGVVAMAGQWPDVAWAGTMEVSGNGNSSTLRIFRWRRDRWVASGKSAELAGPLGGVVFPWQSDGLVALAPTPFGPTRVLAVAERAPSVPALSRAVQSQADRESYPCQHALIAPEAAVEIAPGDVMIFAGQLCGVPTAPNGDAVQARHLGVERLRAGQKQGEVSLLPVPSGLPADTFWNVDGAAALSATAVLVAASGTGGHFSLTRWNGEHWTAVEAPFKTLSGLWAQAGAFWVTDEFGTAWLGKSAGWSRIDWHAPPLQDAAEGPRREELSQIVALDAHTTWLVRHEERGGEVTSRLFRVELHEKAP